MITERFTGELHEELVLGHPRNLYQHAVLHILVSVIAGQWRLLFAFIELLPSEVPPPLHDGCRTGPQLRKRNCRIFADHVPLTASAGLDWYEDARRGRVVRPAPDGSVPRANDPRAKLCQPLDWSEEPIWPRHVLANAEHRLPFLSRWHRTPRMHHLMPMTTAWDYSPEESAIVDTFLEGEVGFRRSSWAQLAESIHLVAPNPYYRTYRQELISAPSPEIESVQVRVDPRNGVELPALEVALIEHRPTGCATAVSVPLDAQSRTVAIGPAMHEMSATVQLKSGSLLETSPPASWLREFWTEMNPVHGERNVQVVDAKGNPDMYQVSIVHRNVGRCREAEPMRPVGKLAELMHEVSVSDTATRLQQHWFGGKRREAARDFIRSLIRPARDQVLIADPYLGHAEIKQYALAVGLARVPVRLLTTGEAFPQGAAQLLLDEIAKWRTQDPTLGSIEVKIMETNELHDRFLRIDNHLYALGNSLNSLGDTGSLFIRIPNPVPIFDALEQIWTSRNTRSLATAVTAWRKSKDAQ